MRRSDFFRPESKQDFFASKPDYIRNKQYMSFIEEEQESNDQIVDNTTTDSSEDYLSPDTESVDRLVLDGETRDPINSSTIDSYNF